MNMNMDGKRERIRTVEHELSNYSLFRKTFKEKQLGQQEDSPTEN